MATRWNRTTRNQSLTAYGSRFLALVGQLSTLLVTDCALCLQPLDWSLLPRAALGVLALLAGNGYIVGINQIYDVDIDTVSKPFLPIAAGMLSQCIPFVPAHDVKVLIIAGVRILTSHLCVLLRRRAIARCRMDPMCRAGGSWACHHSHKLWPSHNPAVRVRAPPGNHLQRAAAAAQALCGCSFHDNRHRARLPAEFWRLLCHTRCFGAALPVEPGHPVRLFLPMLFCTASISSLALLYSA